MTGLAVGVALTEGSGTVVDRTDAALTHATVSTVGICSTPVETNGIDADLTCTAVSIGDALTGDGRDILTAPLRAPLSLRTRALFITGRHARAIDAETIGTTLVVKPADLVLRPTLAIRAHETRGALAAFRTITSKFTTGAWVIDAGPILADHPRPTG